MADKKLLSEDAVALLKTSLLINHASNQQMQA